MTIPVSQTKFGKNEPFELQVSRGEIPNHRSVVVFGYNPDVDTSEVTVWPLPSIITHPATAIQIKVSSTSANDTTAGTGARTVVIEGLSNAYEEISETVILNGQTEVLTTKLFRRINYAYVATAGSTNSAVGDIYMGTGTVTAGVPATIYNIIKYDYNNTVTGHYTIPAGYTAYLSQGLFSAGQISGSTQIRGRLITTSVNNIRYTTAVTTVNNGSADYVFEYPVRIPEKTDIEATATGGAVNNSATSMFILVLVKNTTD
jgi:hypothetical protein